MNASRARRTRAFTLIELMISLVILATLMAAVGLAFDASTKNYTANEGMIKTMNAARQALLRITTDIRTCQGVSAIGVDDPDNYSCTLTQSGGAQARYLYNDPAAGAYDASLDPDTLYVIMDPFGAGSAYVLCRNVTAMSFDRHFDGSNVRNVRISMTVVDDTGNISKTLNTAAVIRTIP